MRTKKPKHIRREMAETRQEIHQTVELLQDQLEVRKIARAGLSKVREATETEAKRQLRKVSDGVDSAGSTMTRLVRRNPLVTALMGVGLGLLLTNRHSNTNDKMTRKGLKYDIT